MDLAQNAISESRIEQLALRNAALEGLLRDSCAYIVCAAPTKNDAIFVRETLAAAGLGPSTGADPTLVSRSPAVRSWTIAPTPVEVQFETFSDGSQVHTIRDIQLGLTFSGPSENDATTALRNYRRQLA